MVETAQVIDFNLSVPNTAHFIKTFELYPPANDRAPFRLK